MIITDYETALRPFVPRLVWEHMGVNRERLGVLLYWLIVRAGVAGRRAERADVAAWAPEAFAYEPSAAWVRDSVMGGDHVGAARRASKTNPEDT